MQILKDIISSIKDTITNHSWDVIDAINGGIIVILILALSLV